MIVDAKGLVAGRLASKLAKAIVNGESVVVINSEDAVVVGSKNDIVDKFRERVNAEVKSNPHRGPKYSRMPSRIFKRMVNGMLPNRRRTQDRLAKQLKVYNGTPAELAKEKTETFEDAKFNERHHSMTIKEIALMLGGKW